LLLVCLPIDERFGRGRKRKDRETEFHQPLPSTVNPPAVSRSPVQHPRQSPFRVLPHLPFLLRPRIIHRPEYWGVFWVQVIRHIGRRIHDGMGRDVLSDWKSVPCIWIATDITNLGQ
jgi:hypothetical protein